MSFRITEKILVSVFSPPLISVGAMLVLRPSMIPSNLCHPFFNIVSNNSSGACAKYVPYGTSIEMHTRLVTHCVRFPGLPVFVPTVQSLAPPIKYQNIYSDHRRISLRPITPMLFWFKTLLVDVAILVSQDGPTRVTLRNDCFSLSLCSVISMGKLISLHAFKGGGRGQLA